MRLKSIIAANMNEAMRIAREEFGTDAIIVSAVPLGDNEKIRVTIAIDRPLKYEAEVFVDEPLHTTSSKLRVVQSDPIDQLRDLANFHGLSTGMIEDLMMHYEHYRLGDSLSSFMQYFLNQCMGFEAIDFSKGPQRIMAIGVFGGGKTTSIAKLATRALLVGLPVHVISIDHFRVGGIQQLGGLTHIMNIPFHPARNYVELRSILSTIPKHHSILLDAAGINPYNDDDVKTTMGWVLESGVEPIWVMPCGTSVGVMEDMVPRMKDMGIQRLVVSKMDVHKRYGDIIHLGTKFGFKMADFGISPHIAHGLQQAKASFLADCLINRGYVYAKSSR